MNYSNQKKHCETQSELSRNVIDTFLMNFAGEKEKLLPVILTALKKYKHVVHQFEEEHIKRWNAEFIVHHVFKKGDAGLKLEFLPNQRIELKLPVYRKINRVNQLQGKNELDEFLSDDSI